MSVVAPEPSCTALQEQITQSSQGVLAATRAWTAQATAATLAGAARLRDIPLVHSATTALTDTASSAAAVAVPALSSAYGTVAATAALAVTTVRTKTPAVVLAVAARLAASPEKVLFLQSAAFLTYFLISEHMMHGKLEEQQAAKAREMAAIRQQIEHEFDARADVEKRRLAEARLVRMATLHKKIDERGRLSKLAEQAKEAQAREAAAEAKAEQAHLQLASAAAASAAETQHVRARLTVLQKRLAEAVQTQSSTREHAELSAREAQRAHERLSRVESELEDALARAQENEEIRKQIEAVSASNRAESVKADLLRRQLAEARRASREVEQTHDAAAAAAAAAATASQREVEELSHKLEQVERMVRMREADYRSEIQATREAHAQRLAQIMRQIEEARGQASAAHARLTAARERQHSLGLSVKDSLTAAIALEEAAASKAQEYDKATAADRKAGALDGPRDRHLVETLAAQRAAAQEESEALAKTAVMTERQAALARTEMGAVRASAEEAKGDDGADKRFELLQAASKRSEARYAIQKRRSLLVNDAAAVAMVRFEQACLAEKEAVRAGRSNATDAPASRLEVDAHTARVSALAARRHCEALVEKLTDAKEAADAAQQDYDTAAQVEARLQAKFSFETAASDQVKARQGPPAPGQPASVIFKGASPAADNEARQAARVTLRSDAMARATSPKTVPFAKAEPPPAAAQLPAPPPQVEAGKQLSSAAVPAHPVTSVSAPVAALSSDKASGATLKPQAAEPTTSTPKPPTSQSTMSAPKPSPVPQATMPTPKPPAAEPSSTSVPKSPQASQPTVLMPQPPTPQPTMSTPKPPASQSAPTPEPLSPPTSQPAMSTPQPPASQPTVQAAATLPEQPTTPDATQTPRPPSVVRQVPLKPPPVKQLPLRSSSIAPSFDSVAHPDVSPAADQIRTQFGMPFADDPAGTPAWVQSTSEPSLNATDFHAQRSKHGPRMRVLRLDSNVPAQRLLVIFPEASKVEAVYSKRTGERKDVVVSFKLGTPVQAMRSRAQPLGCTLHPIVRPMEYHNDVRMIAWTRTQLKQAGEAANKQAAEPAKKTTQA
jgi:hypothetical protein